jgi:hypothetical protein
MDEAKLREIEALTEKRTPGAWRAKDHVVDAYRGDVFDAHVACCDGCGEAQDARNAAAVAAVMNASDELLAAERVALETSAWADAYRTHVEACRRGNDRERERLMAATAGPVAHATVRMLGALKAWRKAAGR